MFLPPFSISDEVSDAVHTPRGNQRGETIMSTRKGDRVSPPGSNLAIQAKRARFHARPGLVSRLPWGLAATLCLGQGQGLGEGRTRAWQGEATHAASDSGAAGKISQFCSLAFVVTLSVFFWRMAAGAGERACVCVRVSVCWRRLAWAVVSGWAKGRRRLPQTVVSGYHSAFLFWPNLLYAGFRKIQ